MAQLIGKRFFSAIANLPAPLHYFSLQRQQILEFANQQNLEREACLSQEAKELQWWVNNLKLTNKKNLVATQPEIVIASDASMKGKKAVCQGQITGGT